MANLGLAMFASGRKKFPRAVMVLVEAPKHVLQRAASGKTAYLHVEPHLLVSGCCVVRKGNRFERRGL